MASPTTIMIACRRLSGGNRLQPGYLIAKCTICTQTIQVSPTGREQMRTMPDVVLLCNDCGLKVVKARDGKSDVILANPAAERQSHERREFLTPESDEIVDLIQRKKT